MKKRQSENPLILEQTATAKEKTEWGYANRNRKSVVKQEEKKGFSFLVTLSLAPFFERA